MSGVYWLLNSFPFKKLLKRWDFSLCTFRFQNGIICRGISPPPRNQTKAVRSHFAKSSVSIFRTIHDPTACRTGELCVTPRDAASHIKHMQAECWGSVVGEDEGCRASWGPNQIQWRQRQSRLPAIFTLSPAGGSSALFTHAHPNLCCRYL